MFNIAFWRNLHYITVYILTDSRNSSVFVFVLKSQKICLHSQILSHLMSSTLIKITQVKLWIIISNIWRHFDVHSFSQNFHYASRYIVWRKQTNANLLLEDRQTKRHPIFVLNVSFMKDRWWRKFDDVTLKWKIWFSRTKQKRTKPFVHNLIYIG